MLQRARARLHTDAGVTLVEVLVAATVLVLGLSGIAAGVIGAIRLVESNSDRVVATTISHEVVDGIRATPYEDILVGERTSTVDRGGIAYEVIERSRIVPVVAETSACSSPSTARPGYLAVSVTVLRPGAESSVTTDTIISPPADAEDPSLGHVSVEVLDRDGAPSEGRTVRLAPEATGTPVTQLTTDASGCVFFANLAPSRYAVWLNDGGYIDRASGEQDTRDGSNPTVVTVAAARTVGASFEYDRAARVDLSYDTTGPTLPDDVETLDVYLANPGVQPSGVLGFDALADAASTPLFPFPSGYRAWAGCPNAPSDHGSALATDPGATATATLPLARVDVQVRPVVSGPGGGPPFPARTFRIAGTCDGAASVELTTTSADTGPDAVEEHVLAVPVGTWTISLGSYTPVEFTATGSTRGVVVLRPVVGP